MKVLLARAEAAEASVRKAQNENRTLKKMEWYTNLEEEEREKFHSAYTSQEKHLDTLLAEGSMDTLGRVVFEADGQTSWWVVLDDNERLVDDLGRSTMVDA